MDLPSPPLPLLVRYGPGITARLQDSLRKCQKDALDELVQWFQSEEKKAQYHLKKNDSTAVVVMPTGSGKTGVICSLPYWFGNAIANKQLGIDLQQPILVIAPGIDILNQLECDLVQSVGEKPCFLAKVGAIKDDRKELRSVLYRVKVTKSTKDVHKLCYFQEDIVLINAQNGPTWRELDEDLFPIIIVDEAHHLPAPQWQDIIDRFQRHAKTYGYAYQLEDQAAVKDGIIRPIKFKENLIKFSVGEPKHKYDPKNTAVHDHYVEVVVDKVIKCVLSKDQKCPLPEAVPHCAMLITSNTNEAEKVADICRKNGPEELIAEHVHGTMSKKEYRAVMKKIENKEVRVLVIVKKLLEGFNYPCVSVVGIVTRIHSSLLFAQFVGRARRVIRGESNVTADIITHEYFEQEEPYNIFRRGHLIRRTDDAAEVDD